jgi:hypothetical protein
MLANYMQSGRYNRKTLLGRAIESGESVLKVAFCQDKFSKCYANSYANIDNGIVDSLKVLIMHENFIKHYSEEHILTRLLTRAF